MGNQGQIIFIGEFRFPEGDAAAIRTLSLARICRDLGFKVTVIGKGRLCPEHYLPESGEYCVEGIYYSTMNPRRVSAIHRLRHPIERIRLYVSTLEALNLKDTRAVIINASGSALHVPSVSAFCRRKSIPLICDVCEWYDPCQMSYGRLNPAYAAFWVVFHYFLPRERNFIVVSRLLESHFKGRGRNIVRIAAPFDVSKISCVDNAPHDRLVLLYAGMPGRKDLLKEIFLALASLSPDERSRIEFRLLGPTKQELRKLLGESASLLDTLGESVKPMGRVHHDQVIEALQKAHFTVLLRPDKRYANAGFPSKVPESLAAGVPVLLNFTSDLREYLEAGNAVLPVDGCSSVEVAKTIRQALGLSPAELTERRRGARAVAERSFDYRLYLDSCRGYLGRLS